MFLDEMKKAQAEPQVIFDQFFDMDHVGNHYKLTFKKELFKELKMSAFHTDNLNVTIDVETNGADQMRRLDAYVSAKDEDFELTASVVTLITNSVTMTAPSDVITLDQFQKIYPFAPIGFLSTFPANGAGFPLPPEETYIPAEEYEYENTDEWYPTEEPATTPRVGERPSVRSIQEQARKQNAKP